MAVSIYKVDFIKKLLISLCLLLETILLYCFLLRARSYMYTRVYACIYVRVYVKRKNKEQDDLCDDRSLIYKTL